MTAADMVAGPGGVAPPRRPVPPGACDAHLHVLDARFPPHAGTRARILADNPARLYGFG